ncbi:MAG: hypothetical protein HOO87_03950 [Methyloglobulus sp.]|nr:hypothetical protein [Methyloglobulus sp.]
MVTPTRNRINPTSLSAQIKDAEQQVLNRKQKISVNTATLVRKMQQQMIAPTTFIFAAGIGFLLGEITKREPSKTHGTTDNPHADEVSPLRTALSLVTSIQTLYTALPIAWIINTFNQRGTSRQASEQPIHRAKDGS